MVLFGMEYIYKLALVDRNTFGKPSAVGTSTQDSPKQSALPHQLNNYSHGETYGENGEIPTALGDICPRCCTQRLRERLQDIKTLLTHCNCEHEAVRTAKRRLMAMSAFLSRNSGPVLPSDDGGFSTHPAEIAGIVSGVDELGDAVFDAALADFAAARAMMRPAAEPRLLQPIGRIREDALRWSAYGDKAVKKCAAEIVREADLMIKDIESDQKAEAQLAVALEAESRKLKMALASRAQENKRYREALEKPNF